MAKIIIAVGSKRGPKLNAVKEALDIFSAALSPGTEFELTWRSTSSWTTTPRTNIFESNGASLDRP